VTPHLQLHSAVSFLDAALAQHRVVDHDLIVLQATLARNGLCVDDDQDLAWVVAKVGFALGPPGAEPDLDAARACARTVQDLLVVRRTDYARIGEPYPPHPYAFMLVPGDPDRVMLLPKLGASDKYERVMTDGEVYAALRGRRVAWPPFEPPPIGGLAANDYAATGFVPVALCVPGTYSLPPDARVRLTG
jgi:hypothetical protein